MSQHVEHDTSPELIFTRDFREYIRGRFRPGLTATIRYDPYRVVPPDDGYRFGDPDARSSSTFNARRVARSLTSPSARRPAFPTASPPRTTNAPLSSMARW